MKVIILRERFCDTLVFSSEEKLLEYFKWFYPKAKNLRVKRSNWSNALYAYSHNTPIFASFEYDLEEIEIDEEIRKQNERTEGRI